MNDIAIIILAAGKGTRMKSQKAKVLHELNGHPMLSYVIKTSQKITKNCVIVVGHQADEVQKAAKKYSKDVKFAFQNEQLGTGHAVLCALPCIDQKVKDVIILCGDVPLIKSETLTKIIDMHNKNKNMVSLIAMKLEDPTGYGRLFYNDEKRLKRIIEEADATEKQRKIKIVNSGTYIVNRKFLLDSVSNLEDKNAQKEFYLTDIIEKAYLKKINSGFIIADNPNELSGVNDIKQLKRLEKVME